MNVGRERDRMEEKETTVPEPGDVTADIQGRRLHTERQL
jgi:hypothetical protein